MRVYIHTVPKAGTYFLAELVSFLGFENSGLHVDRNAYLATKDFSLEENAKNPGVSEKKKPFFAVLRELPDNTLCFGHLAVPMNPHVVPPDYKFIAAYRDPRKTLVSEFIDFRFRRQDIDWLSKEAIESDQEAFLAYLTRHGLTVHLSLFKQIVGLKALCNDNIFLHRFFRNRVSFVNFDEVLVNPAVTQQIASFLGVNLSDEEAADCLQKARDTDTKTKADDVQIDRDSLWTDASRIAVNRSEFASVVGRGTLEGLKF